MRRISRKLPAARLSALALALGAILVALWLSTDSRTAFADRPQINGMRSDSNTNPTSSPNGAEAPRITVSSGETVELPIATGADSFVVVKPDIASVEQKDRFHFKVAGLSIGETMLIVTHSAGRQTYVIQVGKPKSRIIATQQAAADPRNEADPLSGTLEIGFSPRRVGGPALFRTALDAIYNVSPTTKVHVNGLFFQPVGRGRNGDLTYRSAAVDRLNVQVDTGQLRVEAGTTSVSLSPLTVDALTVQGVQVRQVGKRPGVEVFAGMTRRSVLGLATRGKLAGATMPIANFAGGQLRAGAMATSGDGGRGVIGQLAGTFAPNPHFNLAGELDLDRTGISGRVRGAGKFGRSSFNFEVLRRTPNELLSGIGVQTNGRSSENFGVELRPMKQLQLSGGFTDLVTTSIIGQSMSSLARRTVFAAATWKPMRSSTFGIRYVEQRFDQPLVGGASLSLGIRSLTVTQNQKMGRFDNGLEIRYDLDKDSSSGSRMWSSLGVNEQLRVLIGGARLTGFASYSQRSFSLADLLIRQPNILPPDAQKDFLADPSLFLSIYRDRLEFLLGHVDLPNTANVKAGVGYSKTIGPVTVNGTTGYSQDTFALSRTSGWTNSVSANVRLDKTDSVGLEYWSQPGAGRSVTFSYRHTFGGRGMGAGRLISRLLGTGRGKVTGRVYNDLNANGRDDNEPGVAGITVRLDDGHSAVTTADGRYSIDSVSGTYDVRIESPSLGALYRATSPGSISVKVVGGSSVTSSFGITDGGSIALRVRNDLGPGGVGEISGLKNVHLTWHSVADPSRSGQAMTDPSGSVELRGMRPGDYEIELDTATVPPGYDIPGTTTWHVRVLPIRAQYLDIQIVPQRGVLGTVFVDKNSNGRYDSGIDLPVGSAAVSVGDQNVITNEAGAYMLSGLPAGNVAIVARTADDRSSGTAFVKMPSGPGLAREVNIKLNLTQ